MDSSLSSYVQPIASHIQHPERLLVRDQAGHLHLWFGNGAEMTEVSNELATWIFNRPEITCVPAPRHWYDVDVLPLAAETCHNEWSVAD